MINNETRSYGFMGEVVVPDWLPDAESRAKWLTITDAERSDWARAHGSAVSSSASAAAAEAAGQVQQHAQAAAMQRASEAASIPASIGYKPPVVWYRQKGFMIAAAGAGGLLLLYLAVKPSKKRPPAVMHSHPKKK